MVTPLSLLLFAAAFTVLFAGGSAWRKRHVPGGLALSLTLFAISIWCFFSAMETTSPDAAHRYLWNAISYIGIANVAPLFLVFAIQYSESSWPLSPGMIAFFWAVPVATIALAFTNSLHHLIWTGFTPGRIPGTNTVIYSHGAWYFFSVLWFLATCLVATYHILRVAIRAASLYLLQSLILVGSVLVPWIGFLLSVLPAGPVPGLDTMSLGFALSALLILAAFNRLRLLDLVPRARSAMVEDMQDGFLVLDALDRIIDINSTASRLLGTRSPPVGKELRETFPALSECLRRNDETLTLSPPGRGDMTLEVSVTKLTSKTGRRSGKILLMRDVTERRRAEKEREKLVADLSNALTNLKRLSGLLPICASCKKIRDDKGYWHQVENYMKDHAEVEFSHGICPECSARLYPDLQD